MSITNNETITQSTNDGNPYFRFDTYNGVQVLVLQETYRGNGLDEYPFSLKGENVTEQELPELLEVPDEINGTQVNSLAPGIFAGNSKVKQIELPSTIHEIPEGFCCKATNLQSVHINGSITTIRASAFKSTNLKEALFPDADTLGASVFSGCACLEIANIGSVTQIPSETFKNCTLLREVTTGEVVSIGEAAFYSTGIKEALFPHLNTLGGDAFSKCACLEVADIGAIIAIPPNAFSECTLLRKVTTGEVVSIGEAAFYSTGIKEALFPHLNTLGEGAFLMCPCLEVADIGAVTAIPPNAFKECTLLREVSTGEIISIGKSAFYKTRIKQARFPNLNTLGAGAFVGCAYLEVANIGNVTTIPNQTFANCALLREVIGEKVSSIDKQAFYQTRSLRDLPLLTHVTHVEEDAFYYSRICTSLPTSQWINSKAFPTGDNHTNFWSGVKFTPRRNRLTTKLSQLNAAWWTQTFLLDEPLISDELQYSKACALFAVMHIHSALSGKYYSHPEQFVGELKSNPKLSKFLYYDNWPGQFKNVAPMFEALGYRAEVRGSGTNLTKDDYRALVDALAHGAYIYAQVAPGYNWQLGKYNQGHAVVIYGINELGEVCVLDSNILHEDFRAGGFEPGIDVYTYAMPYQNMVGPGSDFVIVYPTREDSNIQLLDSDVPKVFTSATRPSEYPEGRITVSHVTNDLGTPGSENGILTACRVGKFAYRTFIPDGKPDFYVQIKDKDKIATDEKGDPVTDENGDPVTIPTEKWLEWRPCSQKNISIPENRIFLDTQPADLPIGIAVSVVDLTAGSDQLPEATRGYLTSYRIHYESAYAREEFLPEGSTNVYMRHATDRKQWSNWYVFESSPDANSENQ